MSLDITALRLLKHRDRWEKLSRAVPKKALQPTTASLLEDFGAFFREFDKTTKIEHGPFLTWFKGFRQTKLQPTELAVYEQIIAAAMSDVSPDIEAGLMARLVAAESAANITSLLEKWHNGDEVDLYSNLRSEVEKFEQQLARKVKTPQVLTPIEDLLKAEENDTGLHWRLRCLNDHIKPLRAGDFVIVAARPDRGKTTFCASELTHMAAQVDTVYPDEKRSILWFNNEGLGDVIIKRQWQAALGITMEEMVRYNNTAASTDMLKHKYATLLREKYAEALGGRPGVLRTFDIHGMWNHEVEDIIKAHRPALILFDMVDNIRFGDGANNNGQRTDQLLEAMYQWARVLGVKHDCPVMATSQISADGHGISYPTLPQLKDSKTGKQGAADVIITIGALDDPMMDKSRFIGTTKNKKVRTGKKASPQAEVFFDAERGRYKDVQL